MVPRKRVLCSNSPHGFSNTCNPVLCSSLLVKLLLTSQRSPWACAQTCASLRLNTSSSVKPATIKWRRVFWPRSAPRFPSTSRSHLRITKSTLSLELMRMATSPTFSATTLSTTTLWPGTSSVRLNANLLIRKAKAAAKLSVWWCLQKSSLKKLCLLLTL